VSEGNVSLDGISLFKSTEKHLGPHVTW